MALNEHGFEFATNMWVAESFTNQVIWSNCIIKKCVIVIIKLNLMFPADDCERLSPACENAIRSSSVQVHCLLLQTGRGISAKSYLRSQTGPLVWT